MDQTKQQYQPQHNAPNSITAPITYITSLAKYEHEVPYYLLGVQSTPDVPETNIELISKDMTIRDLRAHGQEINIQDNAFQLFDWPHTGIQADSDYEEVNVYCKDMADLLAQELNAEKVYVFDIRFRNSDPDSFITKSEHESSKAGPAKDFLEKPVFKAHVDQTEIGGSRRLRLHLTDSEFSEYILSGRYRARIINVWRSFNGAADDTPLAFCHPNTIRENDPISIDIVESKRLAQNYYLRYNKEHQWFWAGDMSPSEVMVFTTWDSQKTGRTTDCAYHTAFPNPASDTLPRKSLEIRTIVINSLE